MIGLIVASDRGLLIGRNNELPFREPVDLKRFKSITQDCNLIVGRKTLDSIPFTKAGFKLPGRTKYVLSRNPGENTEDTLWFTNWDSLLAKVYSAPKNTWIIGGKEIYEYAIQTCLPDYIDHTIFDYNVELKEGDVPTYLDPIRDTYCWIKEEQHPTELHIRNRTYIYVTENYMR